MAGARCLLLSVSALVFVAHTAAPVFGGNHGGGSSTARSSYYYYAPTPNLSYYYYCPTTSAITIVPVPSVFANPTPAPASQTVEPPLHRQPTMPPAKISSESTEPRQPIIITTRSQAAGNNDAKKELCRVGFWNLSGRDVTLTIEGKSWSLPRDRSITLDVDRNFAWQIDQRYQRVERIPEGQSTHELVIRD